MLYKIAEYITKNKVKIAKIIGIFLLYVCLLSAFKNVDYFTDEGDNFYCGIAIAKGLTPYSQFFSQHLPGMYYIMSIVSFFGAKTVEQFRIGSYILLSLLWTGMYIRYSKHFKPIVLFVYPVLYICAMSLGNFLCSTMVAEQFEAQFIVILVLELILFYKNKGFIKHSELIIGLSIFTSIMCTLMSAIPIFIFIVALFCIDIYNYSKDHPGFHPVHYLSHFFKQYYHVLIYTIAPVLIYILILVFTGTLQQCYEQTFYLNTAVYQKYSGISGNIFNSIIFCIPNYIMQLKDFFVGVIQFQTFTQAPSDYICNFAYMILNIGAIICLIKIIKKERLLAVFIFLIALTSGSRGFTGFHGMACVGCMTFLMTYNIEYLTKINKIQIPFYFVGVLVIMWTYLYYDAKCIIQPINDNRSDYTELNEFLDDSDTVFFCNLDTNGYINSGRMSSSRLYSVVPWFSELYENVVIEDIETVKPKIVMFSPEFTVWGYVMKDYAPDLTEYMMSHYTYTGYNGYLVRNDLVEDFENSFDIQIPDKSTDNHGLSVSDPLKGQILKQYLEFDNSTVSSIGLRFGTYERTNHCQISITIYDNMSNPVFHINLDSSELIDNEFYNLDVGNMKVVIGEQYSLEITASGTNDNDFVSIYYSDYTGYENEWLEVDGIRQDCVLDYNIFYSK